VFQNVSFLQPCNRVQSKLRYCAAMLHSVNKARTLFMECSTVVFFMLLCNHSHLGLQ
jgi:hypothetical protein